MFEDLSQKKIEDINKVQFGNNLAEVIASMEILMTLFHFDDNPEVIKACKERLKEGIEILKQLGAIDVSKAYRLD